MTHLIYTIPLAIIPALLYVTFLYINLPLNTIKFKRALTFLFGGMLSVPFLLFFYKVVPFWGDLSNNIINPLYDRSLYLHIKYFIQVGFLEELIKFATYYWIVNLLINNNKIVVNDSITTMVNVAMVGLGFAIIENIKYSLYSDTPILTLIWRSFTAMLAHLFYGLYMGYFIVKSNLRIKNPKTLIGGYFERKPKVKFYLYNIVGVFIGSMIHGIYNLQLVLNSPNGLSGAYILFVALTIGMVLCLNDIKNQSKVGN